MNRTAHLRTMCILPVLALMPLAAFGQQATVGAAATLKSHEARYQQMMQRFGDEPNIRTVQEDAIRYATAEPERVQSWFTRTAWANVLPERLQGRVDVDNRDNRNASTKDGVETSGRTDVDEDVGLQLTVEWDLSKLIFNPDVVRTAAQAIDIAELREDVLNAVTKIYFERRSLRVELETAPPADFGKYAAKRLRVDELTADLDALTGGAFSARVRQKRGKK